VPGEHVGDAGGELLGVGDMEELARAVRVGVRAEHAGNEQQFWEAILGRSPI